MMVLVRYLYVAHEGRFKLFFFVGNDVDKYVKLLEKGRKSIRLRKKYYFKNKIFSNIQVQ